MNAVLQPSDIDLAAGRINTWIVEGPARFAVDMLGVPERWDESRKSGVLPWQWETSRRFARTRRISIRSGKGVGKSAFMSWTILWFHSCFFPAKSAATAPTATQMSDVLWAELSMWHRRLCELHPQWGARFEWKTDAFCLADAPQESFSVARTARAEKPEALQGIHSKHTLILADEASGVADVIFEAGRGALSGENAYVVLASNPTRLSGLFHDTHHKLKPLWETIVVNGEDVPLQTQNFRDEIIYQYGRDSNYYRVNVTGEFPSAEDDVVIPLSLCEAAMKREVKPFGPVTWGLDVARFGSDRCVLIKRRDNATTERHKSWGGMDTMQTAGKVFAEYKLTPPEQRPHLIVVDVIGIGAGVVDRMQELDLPVMGLNVAEAPSVEDTYVRQRDELWFRARQWLEQKHCALVADDTLVSELTLPKYTFTSTGKIKVESKDEMRRRYPRSPDVADALCLTFVDAVAYRGRQSYEPTYAPDF